MRYVTYIVTSILGLIFITGTAFSMTVTKNEDKPAKGEWDFDLQELWKVDSAGDDILVSIQTLAVSDDGNVYILERKHKKVFVLSPEGKSLFAIGRRGEGPGEFKNPQALFLLKDHIIVRDIGNEIKFLTKRGQFQTSFKLSLNIPPKNFIDENRYLTIRTNYDSRQKKETMELYDIKERKGTVITEVTVGESLKATSGTGSQQTTLDIRGSETTPSIIMTSKNNKIYFGYNDNYLIKKIGLDGKEELSFSIEGRKRKPIPLSYKKGYVGSMRLGGGAKLPPGLAKKMMDNIPDECSYFNKIFIDEKGMIYVYLTDLANRSSQEIDIFSPEGKYLYHGEIKLPQGVRKVGSFVLHRDHMLAFVEFMEEEEEERRLVKFKIKTPQL